MRSALYGIVVILLLTTQGEVNTTAADDWRVVVQDATPEPLSISSDGKLIAARGRWSQHVFHALNRDASQILLTVHLPRVIRGAAIANSGDWLVVSTEEHIYRVELADGSAKILLENVSGAVALDEGDQRLAVLGRLGEEGELPFSRYTAPARLGVYDLKQGRWQSRVKTPILVGHLVTFAGDEVFAAGRGGRVFHRAPSSYPCHVRLNSETGQATKGHGPVTGVGARPKPTPKDKKEEDYAPPDAIQTTRKNIEAATERVKAMQEQLSAGLPVRPGDHNALTANDKRVLAVFDHGRAQHSLLAIDSNGDVSIRGVEIGNTLTYCDGRLLGRDWGNERHAMVNLETGKAVFSVPRLSRSDHESWVCFLAAGCLVRKEDRLSFYHPKTPKPLWERQFPAKLDESYPLRSSPDGSCLALGIGGDSEDLVQVMSARTGKTIGRIPRPDGADSYGYPQAAAFSRDGKQLVVVHQRTLRVYDVGSGQAGYERKLGKKEYLWAASSVDKSWLLGGSGHSLFLNARKRAEIKIPLERIHKALPVSRADCQTFLVETSRGLGGLVTRKGKVLRSWVNEKIGPTSDDLNAPPLSGVAFEGRVVARLTGGPEVDLIDARTLKPIARIHLLKLAKGWGWIVHTPDGYWDSSPGAERYVVVFKNGQQAQPTNTQSRRIESLLKSRFQR